MIAKGDYKAAAETLHHVLGVHPSNYEAAQAFAELADKLGSPEAVPLWRHVSELRPDSFENAYSWATAALKFTDVGQATNALLILQKVNRDDSRYHEVMGRLAAMTKHPDKAMKEFGEALRLDPKNPQRQFDCAAIKIASRDESAHGEARRELERLGAMPALRLASVRVLSVEAVARGDRDGAMELSAKRAHDPEANIQDRIFYLNVLRTFKDRGFPAYLSELKEVAKGNPQEAAELMAWLSGKGLAMAAADWAGELPEEMKRGAPVGPETAVVYTLLLDWKKLKPLASSGDWGTSEFLRHAFLARALRETGGAENGATEWSAAVNLAEESPARLPVLQTLATSWGWRPETEALLWLIAGSAENPRDALAALSERYTARGDTHQLYRVWTKVLEIDPNDEMTRNNWAALSLLLGLERNRATEIGTELAEKNPKDAHFVSTYAFAMYLQGRTEDGLAAMRRLAPEQLEAPGVALYYGLLLAAEGGSDAARYLELGKKAPLLPEEEKLLAEAGAPVTSERRSFSAMNSLFHRPPQCDRRGASDEDGGWSFARSSSRQEVSDLVNLFRAASPTAKKR